MLQHRLYFILLKNDFQILKPFDICLPNLNNLTELVLYGTFTITQHTKQPNIYIYIKTHLHTQIHTYKNKMKWIIYLQTQPPTPASQILILVTRFSNLSNRISFAILQSGCKSSIK